MAGTPEFWARTLRATALNSEFPPVDLERLVGWCPLTFAEIELDGCLGLCLRVGKNCGILIKSGQTRGQRRFTIAHELGHFAIPDHAKQHQANHRCLEATIATAAEVTDTEREANTFAAELLMPRSHFIDDIRGQAASMKLIKDLAASEHYDVSLTACAIRLVELSLEPRALLCYENGRLKWQVRSKSFRYYLPPRGTEPPHRSAVKDVVNSGASYDDTVDATDVGWLAEEWDCHEVLESAVPIPALNQALCLLEAVRDH